MTDATPTVTVVAPGSHLMPELLGQRDELLRRVEPGDLKNRLAIYAPIASHLTATATYTDWETAERLELNDLRAPFGVIVEKLIGYKFENL